MLQCGNEIRLTQPEQQRLHLLTRSDHTHIKTAATLNQLIASHVWRCPGDGPEEKLLRALRNHFKPTA